MQCAYCGYNYASPCYGKSAECMNKLAVDAKTGSNGPAAAPETAEPATMVGGGHFGRRGGARSV